MTWYPPLQQHGHLCFSANANQNTELNVLAISVVILISNVKFLTCTAISKQIE